MKKDVDLELTDEDAKIDVDVASASLEKELNNKYNEDFIKLLKRVSYEIAVVGLPIDDACMYVGMNYEKLMGLMQMDPLIERLIKTKDIEYKRGLLKVVSEKAKTDDKTSMKLLESRYSDEFNSKKGTGKGGGGDGEDSMIGMALEFIQRSGDSSPLVTEKSGRAFIVKRSASDNKEIIKRINSVLT